MNEAPVSEATAADIADRTAVLASLIETSIDLSTAQSRQQMLERILSEARRLSGAEAGNLYVRSGENLTFSVAQNDAIDISRIAEAFLGRELSIDTDSLAGFAAKSGEVVNVPDTRKLDSGAPFRINRDFDAASGYHLSSALAVPLKCPDGTVVGVLELINRVDGDVKGAPFPAENPSEVMSLASLAAVSLHNAMLAEQLRRAHLDSIMRLSVAAEFRDRGTAEHIRRISDISGLIARSLGLPIEQVELICTASPMHDIGKIAIPEGILLKPGALTSEERKIVETHCVIGAQILGEPLNELMAMSGEIALSHHERWDGEGYPNRLAGERIPVSARIVCLADVFDALASKRCYKDAYPIDQVADIIHGEQGRHFDPAVAKAFFDIFDEIVSTFQASQPDAAVTG